LKAHALALLSRIPGGKRLYHALQFWLGTGKLDPDEYIRRAVDVVGMIREAGRTSRGGVFLEIGTGWRPHLPFLLYLAGAERIISFDINPWLNETYALETYRALAPRLEGIAECLGLDPGEVQDRYAATAGRATGLRGLLDAFHVQYCSPADARHTGLAGQSVDFVCSSNVLEHVPADVLQEIHRESFRVLKPGGLAVHRFDPADHYSFVDKSITAVNFLRYSEKQWRWYGGTGLAYHNRLRPPQHCRMFERVGFAILTNRVRLDRQSLEAITKGEVTIHPDFAEFSPKELAVEYMWLVCRRPDCTRNGVHGGTEGKVVARS
jgi:SAM-dependent methyltransferase